MQLLRLGMIICGIAAGLTGTPAAADVSAERAWARATPAQARSAVVFMTLTNNGAQARRLIGAETDRAETVSIHESIQTGDVVKMRRYDFVELPGGGTIHFGPGGLHFMLIDLAAPLQRGEVIGLRLFFDDQQTLELGARVQSIAAREYQAPGSR